MKREMEGSRPARRSGGRLDGLLCAAALAAFLWLQSVQLVASCGGLEAYASLKFVFLLGNCIPPAGIGLILLVLTRRWRLTGILSSLLVFLWSAVNHYTYLYAGNVVTVTILPSLGTAIRVLGGYRFTWDGTIGLLAAALALELLLAWFIGRRMPARIPWRRICLPAAGTAVALVFAGILFLRMEVPFAWNVGNDVEQCGYGVYFLRQSASAGEKIREPAGYSGADPAALVEQYQPAPGEGGTNPDIILILNESFYDMQRYTDIQTDVPVMDDWYAVEHAVRGFVATESSTNTTEYELLTGNSTYLLNSLAPFMDFDLRQVNSAARYLKSLGYETWAMHEAPASNYGRGVGYPALGFDHVLFEEDFSYPSAYGERRSTDVSNYMDLLDRYVSAQDGPRFFYLLTYQNHGGYEQNPAEMDTVHTRRDFGNFTSGVEEYLTSVRMSCEAFRGLLSYLDTVERPVLVCMLGDHAPFYVDVLSPHLDLPGREAEVLRQTTPFLLWANAAFGHLEPRENVELSATDVMPVVARTAGLPLSPFYQCILDLSAQIPFRLQDGAYRTAGGTYGSVDTEDGGYEILKPYLWMEYGELREFSRWSSLFLVPGEPEPSKSQ